MTGMMSEKLYRDQGGIVTAMQFGLGDEWDEAVGTTRRRESVRFREIVEGTPHWMRASVSRVYDRPSLRWGSDAPVPTMVPALVVDFLAGKDDDAPVRDGDAMSTKGRAAKAEARRREAVFSKMGIVYVAVHGGGAEDVDPAEAIAAAMERLVEYRRMHEEGPAGSVRVDKTDAEEAADLGMYVPERSEDPATGVAVRGRLFGSHGGAPRKGEG